MGELENELYRKQGRDLPLSKHRSTVLGTGEKTNPGEKLRDVERGTNRVGTCLVSNKWWVTKYRQDVQSRRNLGR